MLGNKFESRPVAVWILHTQAPLGHTVMRHMQRSVRWIIRHHSATPYVTFYVAVVIQGENNSNGVGKVDLMFNNRVVDTNLRTSP